MSVAHPATPSEITDALTAGRIMDLTINPVHAEGIAVLSATIGNLSSISAHPSDTLASKVRATATDYAEQYITGGGRSYAPWHVVYYVTVPGEGSTRLVVACVTASGEAFFNLEAISSKALRAAVEKGMQGFLDARGWEVRADAKRHPVQTEGVKDGEGETFALWRQPLQTPAQEASVVGVFTDRAEVCVARADALGDGRSTSVWVTRGAGAVGDLWSAYEG